MKQTLLDIDELFDGDQVSQIRFMTRMKKKGNAYIKRN